MVKGHEDSHDTYYDKGEEVSDVEWGEDFEEGYYGGVTVWNESIFGGRRNRRGGKSGVMMCRGYKENLPRQDVSNHPCVRMESFPGYTPRSIHVKLRFTRSDPACPDEVQSVLVMGINGNGWPCGEMRLAANEPRKCTGEDLEVPKGQTGEGTSILSCANVDSNKYQQKVLEMKDILSLSVVNLPSRFS